MIRCPGCTDAVTVTGVLLFGQFATGHLNVTVSVIIAHSFSDLRTVSLLLAPAARSLARRGAPRCDKASPEIPAPAPTTAPATLQNAV